MAKNGLDDGPEPRHPAGMNKTDRPARSRITVLGQLCNLIPNHLVPRLARENRAAAQARVLSPWSHVVAMLYAQQPRHRSERRL